MVSIIKLCSKKGNPEKSANATAYAFGLINWIRIPSKIPISAGRLMGVGWLFDIAILKAMCSKYQIDISVNSSLNFGKAVTNESKPITAIKETTLVPISHLQHTPDQP